MITTPDLINALAADAAPVRRLHPPSARTAVWLTFAVLLLAGLTVIYGLQPDLAERLRQPVFVVGNAAALLTGILAAIATFMLSLPDRSRLCLVLPTSSLLVWLSTVGYGCLTNWVSIGPECARFRRTGPVLCDTRSDNRAFVARDAGDAARCGGAAANGGDNDRQCRDRRCRRDGLAALS